MKRHLLAALFVALTATAFAERPSLDEMAVRIGVRDWFVLHSTNADPITVQRLKMIYRVDFAFTDPMSEAATQGQGLKAYAAIWQPLSEKVRTLVAKIDDSMKIAVNGDQAETAFTFRPEGTYKDGRPLTCQTRVTLSWERRDGQWQIIREDLAPLAEKPAELVTAK
jgi:ketosteroid isomerase-like protein